MSGEDRYISRPGVRLNAEVNTIDIFATVSACIWQWRERETVLVLIYLMQATCVQSFSLCGPSGTLYTLLSSSVTRFPRPLCCTPPRNAQMFNRAYLWGYGGKDTASQFVFGIYVRGRGPNPPRWPRAGCLTQSRWLMTGPLKVGEETKKVRENMWVISV